MSCYQVSSLLGNNLVQMVLKQPKQHTVTRELVKNKVLQGVVTKCSLSAITPSDFSSTRCMLSRSSSSVAYQKDGIGINIWQCPPMRRGPKPFHMGLFFFGLGPMFVIHPHHAPSYHVPLYTPQFFGLIMAEVVQRNVPINQMSKLSGADRHRLCFG